MLIMTYGSEVWGFEKLSVLNMLHMKFLKYVLGVNMLTSNYMVYGELGQFSLDVIVKKRMLNYWQRIIADKDSKLCKIIYNSLLMLHMQIVWEEQFYGNVNSFKMTVDKKLKDNFIEKW